MGVTGEPSPLVTFSNPQFDSNPDAGPNVWHKGDMLGDPRTPPYGYSPGQPSTTPIYGWLTANSIPLIDQVPSTAAANNIVNAAAPTPGTPLTLVVASGAGIIIGQSVTNANTGQVVSGLLGIDVNANRTATVTFTNGSPKIGWASNNLLGAKVGDSLTLTTSNTLPTPFALLTTYYIVALGNAAIMLSATPGGAPISATSGGTGTQTANYVAPSPQNPIAFGDGGLGTGGPITSWNPQWALSRTLLITTNGDDTGGTFIVKGFDIYGYPLTQTVTGVSSSTVSTTKAFKYIQSVTPAGVINSTAISVGTNDVFGLPLRTDFYQYIQAIWGTPAVLLAYSAGTFVAADIQTATATSGDVRGTLNPGSASDGTKRLFIYWNPLVANIRSQSGLVGNPQF